MKVCGEIIKIKNGIAYVRTSRPASCEGCANAGICSRENIELSAMNDANGEIGDIVEVEADENRQVIWVISYIFLVPILVLFAGIFFYSLNQWLTLLCIPLIVLYFVFLKKLNRVWKPTNRVVEIKEKVSSQEF